MSQLGQNDNFTELTDPLVVGLMDMFIDGWMMFPSVYPINAVIREQ
jgi:hypothetical protein